LHELRGGLVNAGYSLRQQGTSYFLPFVFALAERKNEKQYEDKVPLCRRLKSISGATE
jgi:hypothetical protein